MTFANTDEKHQTLETHISQDQFILIHLNPAYPGVIIPESFLSGPTLTLKLSYHFQGLTVISKESISAELLFNGKHFSCQIPLGAIWGCTTTAQKNYIWPESLSTDSYANLASEMESIKKPKLAVNKISSTPKLNSSTNEQEPEPAPSDTKKPQLTRIK